MRSDTTEPSTHSSVRNVSPGNAGAVKRTRIAAKRVQDVVALSEAAGLKCEAHTVEALHPWEAIIDHARRMECDLLVMASHGRRGVSALLLGSETQKVLTHSKVPVLVVR